MKFEKACYSRKALYECVDKVKALPRAARVRAEHSALCYGVLAQTFDFCLEKTSCCLFERDFSPWEDYAKAGNGQAVCRLRPFFEKPIN